jgi:hypothetical protein
VPDAVIRRAFDPERWDALGPTAAMQSGRWLGSMLSRLPGAPVTAIHGRGDEAVGFVGAVVDDPAAYEAYNPWRILRGPRPVFEEVHRGGHRIARHLGPEPTAMLPSLVLASPGYCGDPVGPAGTQDRAVTECLRRVCRWAWRQGIRTVAVLYTAPRAAPVVSAAVAALGGETFDLTSRSVRRVTWPDGDGFRAALGRRRSELRRQFRSLNAHGCTVDPVPVGSVFDEVVTARCELLHWYGQPADEAGEARRLRTLVTTFGTGLRLWATRRYGRLVACALFLAHGRTLHNVHVGTTALGRDTPFAHLAATYHGPMRDVSNREFDVIDYGIGHADTKRLQGCETVPLRGHLITRVSAT